MYVLEILEFVMAADFYPNVWIAYRILIIVLVTVASTERSFSKLKLLKNHLRSTMSQERLNGLVMCTIERTILENVDLNTVLDDFSSKKMLEEVYFYEVIISILEVHIYSCFCQHCSLMIIKHVKLKIYLYICFSIARKNRVYIL
jgi:hypothetical protein